MILGNRVERQRRLVAARPFPTDRPSQYPLDDLHRALVEAGVTEVGSSVNAGRALTRLPFLNPGRARNNTPVVGLMGPRERDLAAHTVHGPAVAFCWDVWPALLPVWDLMLRRHPVAMIVTTSRQAATALGDARPDLPVHHLPEATDPNRYRPDTPLSSRRIGVLELGRRSERWHELVTAALAEAGVRHRYQPREQELVFPDARAMRHGLADSVVSVCLPSSTTHPARSGDFCTVTHRYFESMASGCVVLGEAPGELIDLFGYNPVVEIDWNDPAGQVLEIVSDPCRHLALVTQNLARVRAVGSWSARVQDLLALVEHELS